MERNTPSRIPLFRHKMSRVDNLNSLAVKYGVSVQDLKRENKLWNNDHLFLRDELLIPLTAENEGLLDEGDTIVVQDGFSTSYSSNSLSDAAAAGPSGYPNGAASNGRFSPPLFPAERNPPSGASPPPASFPHTSTGKSSSSKGKSKRSPRGDAGDGNDNNNHGGSSSGSSSRSASSITAGQPSVSGGSSSMADDFFSKYDTSIARLRGDVEKMEKNAAQFRSPVGHGAGGGARTPTERSLQISGRIRYPLNDAPVRI
ncbi:lysm and putative peptidoglycan-binding domain-containing protein 2 [Plakobranchus ocellatus]|uniref:Lysm and putative peptidoglycan-binding domain-containing protein 2 n=1 Tax=Plakobranchus ocellatus TaxID=259542 RepID=A0AAV4DTS9_9GAST|nr:lysm and putative peptidoglycan-binding domain-containing protein 2 [Plakobranchus ocellatus]